MAATTPTATTAGRTARVDETAATATADPTATGDPSASADPSAAHGSTTPVRSGADPGGVRTHDHRVRGPFNSWILRVLDGHFHRRLGDVRAGVLGPLAGEVLEVGPGNGPTFRYLGPAVRRVHAVEPNRHFHRRLRRAAASRDLELVLHPVTGEAIDLPDRSVDAAVTSWVLCTVADPDAVLAEIRRVLRPGGRFAFIEHVRAADGSAVRAVQRATAGPWRWFFEGCRTDRATERAIRQAGFRHVEVRDVRVRTPFVPIRPQIAGVAVV